MTHPTFLIIAILAALLALTGCRAPECQKMSDCCAVVKNVEGVGPSCVGLAEDAKDPNTCDSVVRTITFMLEDRGEPIPEACQ